MLSVCIDDSSSGHELKISNFRDLVCIIDAGFYDAKRGKLYGVDKEYMMHCLSLSKREKLLESKGTYL